MEKINNLCQAIREMEGEEAMRKYKELAKKATPRPWEKHGDDMIPTDGDSIVSSSEWLANRNLAIHCVNHFDVLLEAAQGIVSAMDGKPVSMYEWQKLCTALRQAIKEAEGEPDNWPNDVNSEFNKRLRRCP